MRTITTNLVYLVSTQRGRRIGRTILNGGLRHTVQSLRNPYLGW